MEFSELAALAAGHAQARAIQVALKLKLFEVLAQGATRRGPSGRGDCLRRARHEVAG